MSANPSDVQPPSDAAPLQPELTLQQLLDNTTTVRVFAKDLAGRYLFVNRAFEQHAGRPAAEIVGLTPGDIAPADIAAGLRANDRRVIETGIPLEIEETNVIRGERRTLLANKFPLLGADGKPYAVCGISIDITERKRTEEALRRAALAVSTASGPQVFQALARDLAGILGVDAVLIAVFVDAAKTRMRSLATWCDGRELKSFEYQLAQTPCAGVLGREFRFVPQGVHPEFAPGTLFQKLGFDAYAAYSLNDASGAQLGLIAALNRKPLGDRALIEGMLKIFAVKVGAELERARADEALRASEEQYRAIFNASADALTLRDANFRVVDVNPALLAMTGMTREEAIGSTCMLFTPPEQEAATRELFARELAGEATQYEAEMVRKDGTRFAAEVRGVPLQYRGEPHVFVIVRDITERKRAEEAVRASEAQYRAIFNASADALVLWNSDLRRIDVNPAYEHLYGYTREEVLDSNYPSHLPVEYVERRRDLVRRTLSGERCQVELEAVRKNGEQLHVEVRTIPVRYRGEPHVLAIVRDVTERKHAEEALRTSGEQYRAIFNASADALVLRDADFRVVDVNAAYESMSGFRREEVVGIDRVVANPPQVNDLVKSLHRQALAGEPIQLETQILGKDGRRAELELRGVPILHRGRPHVLYIGRDITARKHAEAERVALEAQLRQAQKMEAIGQLTGGIAHDFNNILTSIVGYVTLAAERESAAGDPKLAGYLDQATRSCRRARDLIHQMLTFSRGQRGERHPVDLKKLVDESARLLHSSMPATLDLQTANGGSVPLVSLDPVQAEQVLLNLCINARDALQGQGRVRIAVRRVRHAAVCASCRSALDGEFVELAVSDNGPGIAPEVMERMFEPFYSTKEVGKGSGMGLAMVHGIVHDHGGHLIVETGPGGGATFRVLFPAVGADDAQVEHETLTGFTLPPRRVVLRGRVLLVDDEEMVRGFMRELLEGWGLEVALAHDGTQARETFARAPADYDLLITDQTMPRLTGMELARQVLALRPELPVILYSGYADALTEAQVQAAGIRALVRKPVEPAALRTLLEGLLPPSARAA